MTIFSRRRFTASTRRRAWSRYLSYRSQLEWLLVASGKGGGDFYWSNGVGELLRRKLIDNLDRLTALGHRVQARERAVHPMFRTRIAA